MANERYVSFKIGQEVELGEIDTTFANGTLSFGYNKKYLIYGSLKDEANFDLN